MLGIGDEFEGFDTEIIAAINTAIFALYQVGVGVEDFAISGEVETWDMLFGIGPQIEAAKSYIFLKTKLEFDPPATGPLVSAYERQIEQLEWRISVKADPDYVPEV